MQVEMRFVTVMRESVEEQCKGKETETESKKQGNQENEDKSTEDESD